MTDDVSASVDNSLTNALASCLRTWQSTCHLAPGGTAAEAVQAKHELKAAYLCKLANFVGWPADGTQAAKDPLVLGILGNDSLGDALERATHRQTFQGGRLIIRRGKEVADFKACQVLFIGRISSQLLKLTVASQDARKEGRN